MRNLRVLCAFLAVFALPNHGAGQQATPTQVGPLKVAPATPTPDKDGIYRQGPGIVAPVLVHPVGVASLRKLGKKCAPRSVLISAVIKADGTVGIRDTEQAGNSVCESAAIDAITQSSFQAGTWNNRPVPVLVCLGVSYLKHAEEALPSILPCAEALGATTLDGQNVSRPGGTVKPPVVISQPIAGYSDEARRANYQGVCIVALVVDAQGNPQNVHVIRTLGMGLDEKAVEAVRKYKFKPALKDGKTPVPVLINVEIEFHLYHRP